MGADKARATARRLIEIYSPRLLISLGYGGAVKPDLAPGTVVLGQEYRHYDPGGPTLTPLCPLWAGPSIQELVTHLQAAGLPAAAAVLVTTPRVIVKHREGAPLLFLSNPVLDLETAAVAALAQASEIPFLGLRTITDTGGEEIPDFIMAWTLTVGVPYWRLVWRLVLSKPTHWPYLTRMWHRSRWASHHLALALTTLLPDLGPAV